MIYALKTPEKNDCKDLFYRSLRGGEGRFGWSYVETADLRQLSKRIDEEGWDTLCDKEKDCYQAFLLSLKKDDYVVYINLPEWGRCTLARVVDHGDGPYFWKWGEWGDFAHRFHVDPNSVRDFDRNDAIVQRRLSQRLKLRGRYWRIYLHPEFESLVEALREGRAGKPSTTETRLDFLKEDIRPSLAEITEKIHHSYPRAELEELVAGVFNGVPGVEGVEERGGRGEHGADLIVSYRTPIPGVQGKCVVQVKSFEGEHWDTKAVKQIEEALNHWNADTGLIVSTASASTKKLDDALEELWEQTKKPVGLLIGEELAGFVLRFGEVT